MTENNKHLFYSQLGASIMEFRKKSGLSQEALSEKVDMSRASIVNIEKGRQFPPLHLVWEIANNLEIDLNSLIPKKDFKNSELNPSLKKELKKEAKRSESKSDSFIKLESWLEKELG